MNSFLNRYEAITYGKIREVADNFGAHVFSKVRLADVIPINNSGISDKEFTYALKAHVDFLVTDKNQEPQFCVEFDGPTHKESVQIQRDYIKNELLKRFNMPFIRVNARYLEDKYRGFDLLSYFVDLWFLSAAFDDAQESGLIHWDEPFDPNFVYSDGSKNGKKWPYWLSLNIQLKIQSLCKLGKIVQPVPSHWIGSDHHNNLRCLAWLFISDDECVFIETGMRRHLFHAVCQTDLLSQIAIYDLYASLKEVFEGRSKSKTLQDFLNRHYFYINRYKAGSSSSCGYPKALNE